MAAGCPIARIILCTGIVSCALTSVAQAQASSAETRDPAARNERASELTAQARASVEHGDPGSAVWFLREAMRIDPLHASAAVVLADIYLARGRPAAARDVVYALLERVPSHAALWLRLSRALSALADHAGSAEALREGLRRAPDDQELLAELAKVALQRGQWLRALTMRRALHELGHADVQDDTLDAALSVMMGTSDRARGLRCRAELGLVRRALAGCERVR